MRPFSLLVKPVGAACNLDCAYCFYRNHAVGVMSEEVCAHMVGTYAALPFEGKSIALQGGEPLLAPDYVFDHVDVAPVERSLQTNGTLLTPDRADRLKRGNWLVGLSLDGPLALNSGRGDAATYEKTVAGARLLEDFGVDYNLLAVVSQRNVRQAKEIYRFFRHAFATRFYQFIECTGPCEEISGEEWGMFLCELFDEWIGEDAHTISIRLFDSIVSQLVRGFPTQCSFAHSCRQYLVVEHDGSVYPCDFHVRPDLRLGNVMTHGWDELIESPAYARFADRKCAQLTEECRRCPYVRFCQGDCPRNRVEGRSALCAGWRRFFAHALEPLARLSQDGGESDANLI